MSIEFLKNLPSPEEIKSEFPLGEELIAKKKAFDAEVRDVFTGKSDKFVAVIGPCSADNEEAVMDIINYAYKNTNISYMGINFHIRYCKNCGTYLQEHQHANENTHHRSQWLYWCIHCSKIT